MNIARPSKADIDAVIKLNGIFDVIERGLDPTQIDEEAEDECIDLDDHEACHRVLHHILQSLPRRGGLGRFVWGMATLCDPRNEIIDQDSDVLALHPSLLRAKAGTAASVLGDRE